MPKLHLEIVDTNHGKQMLIYMQLWSYIADFDTLFQPLNPIFSLLLALFLVLLHHVCCFVLGRCTKSFSRKQHPAAAENRAMRVVGVIPNVVVTVFTLYLADTGLRKMGYVGNTQNRLRLGWSASNTKYVIGCSYFTAWH